MMIRLPLAEGSIPSRRMAKHDEELALWFLSLPSTIQLLATTMSGYCSCKEEFILAERENGAKTRQSK
jgi:hypothetical protein